MSHNQTLLQPFKLGELTLNNRVIMAPMTRSRSEQPGDIPTALNAEYYGQRASAGLIITEGVPVSAGAKGYAFTPGIFTDAQQAGWKLVTDAVHAKGGRIAAQLWHVGRISHHSVLPKGVAPVAPSAIQAQSKTFAFDDQGVPGMVDCDPPQALTEQGLAQVLNEFAQAAKRAVAAGFDLVEVHGANGYLLEQFLATKTNKRDDQYGGSLINRARFVLEVVDAVIASVGAQKVGLRVSPWCPAFINDIDFSEETEEITLYLAEELAKRKIAFIHLAEWPGVTYSANFRQQLRSKFNGSLIVCGSYQQSSAQQIIDQGLADAVAFGRPFIANPDLPERFAQGAALAEPDQATFYGGAAQGYTDYPFLNQPG
ncbi:alkene reductase [Pseudomonas sp. 5P_3.1_Bac2]|uniref:alkene reductase n=1 Tax=Pseudomonas sp. 5P_3.1_Bac2 TaxID=2971617 RepID=UPI0021C59964|nr:alkene reductase [Pseudomonas sp. 5P_3.1_Bac2]MCU1717487.1 alkene reductase [Pseudomonas sp. 5P_3.1_Bac2]